MKISTLIKRCPATASFILTFAISWSGSFAVLGPKFLRGEAYQMTDMIPALFAMLLGPSLSGLLLTRVVDGTTGSQSLFRRLRRWQVGSRWVTIAVLTFPVLISAVLLALSRIVSPEFTPSFMKRGVVYGLRAGFFEEIGWMGYASPKMRLKDSILAASLILGLAHGAWHLVADYFGASRAWGGFWPPHYVLMWCFAMVALRVIIVWVYEKTQSVLVAQLTHASSTGFLMALSPSPITPASETLWSGRYGVVLWAPAAIMIVNHRALFLPTRKGGAS